MTSGRSGFARLSPIGNGLKSVIYEGGRLTGGRSNRRTSTKEEATKAVSVPST